MWLVVFYLSHGIEIEFSPMGKNSENLDLVSKNIRVHRECEGRIEKSVPRITLWHHKACRVMTSGDQEGGIFLSYLHMNNGCLFLLTAVSYFKISFQKSLNT